MSYQARDMSGALFKNERKEKDTHPDYRGDVLIDGVTYEIGAWVKEAKSTGKKFFSLSFKVKENRDEQPSRQMSGGFGQRSSGGAPRFAEESDLPF